MENKTTCKCLKEWGVGGMRDDENELNGDIAKQVGHRFSVVCSSYCLSQHHGNVDTLKTQHNNCDTNSKQHWHSAYTILLSKQDNGSFKSVDFMAGDWDYYTR